MASGATNRAPTLRNRWRILGLNENIANDSCASIRELRVVREPLGKTLVASVACTVGELLVERRTLLEGAERRPERAVEGLGLPREQRVRRPGMADTATKSNQLPLAQLPQGSAAVRATERGEHTRVIGCILDPREIDLAVLHVFLGVVEGHLFLLGGRLHCEIGQHCREP